MIRRCFCVLPAVVLAASIVLPGEGRRQALARATELRHDDEDDLRSGVHDREAHGRKCEYKNEERTREVTCNKKVPVTEEKECKYTVMVPETKTRRRRTASASRFGKRRRVSTRFAFLTRSKSRRSTPFAFLTPRRLSRSTRSACRSTRPTRRSTRSAFLTPKR